MKNLRLSTTVTIIALIVGLILGFLGFIQAGNSNVAPVLILIVMLAAAVFFAVAAVIALRKRSVIQRVVGLAAVVAAIYMLGFGIFSYSVLRIEVPEEFLNSDRTQPVNPQDLPPLPQDQ